jgi:hypothetical protein
MIEINARVSRILVYSVIDSSHRCVSDTGNSLRQ